ncbi:MAG: hypothetical protein GX198_08305 [Epulopiscium sp.]|mgnify:FL=1|nr:hypothetical protein [Candidatus Epulonipiscium sp.]HOQ15807.1 hypothetical protein [Defluviitaleaceae bacterium]HPT76002.1 hypothetical protein [Defluviitaleaceae bacterium]
MKPEFKKYERRKNFIFKIVLALLVISLFYAVYMLFTAPAMEALDKPYDRIKSDYVLMILQCLVGIIVMFLPSQIERRYRIEIPDLMEIIYFIFLFCAIYLGEVRNFYFKIPYWDLILHGFSAAMLGAMGFFIVSYLNNMERPFVHLSPFFVALFAFCFALACGTIWEIYEFAADCILGTNMQKFITEEGTVLTGQKALADTMEDLIVDAIGSLVVVTVGYIYLKKKQIQSVRVEKAIKTEAD